MNKNPSDSPLAFATPGTLVENAYALEREATHAALFTVANGYLGVRGSFEEFGSLRIQGAYVRGLIDQIAEAPQIIADNLYMKKYYVDEERMKEIRTHECIVNFADLLTVQVRIAGEQFVPWEGEILSWRRTLDLATACLTREVRWKNTQGDITRFTFERFASFADDHAFCQRVTITAENHDKPIEIVSGLDLRTKTAGQRITSVQFSRIAGNTISCAIKSGELYQFTFSLGAANCWRTADGNAPVGTPVNADGLLANRFTVNAQKGRPLVLEKLVYVITSREAGSASDRVAGEGLARLQQAGYDRLLEEHQAAWRAFFSKFDIAISGDQAADAALRFCNYHTAISIPRNDAIHSLAAKGLTGEGYNNFVWWDCEVFQLPIFLHTVPETARNVLRYRYDKLDAARKIARAEGRRGARYPFNSSVTGEEVVWQHVRHPRMQIHITADVAWGVIHYHRLTGDDQFMLEYGLEMLWEIARYWVSRVEFNPAQRRYEIKEVTGPDEHHPYVDNNAYTNYLVALVLNTAAKLYQRLHAEARAVSARIGLVPDEIAEWQKVAENLYLPMLPEVGLIPQFDGYFDLSKDLQVAGGAMAKSFQMKESGLYHTSQVIKQPDVMMLFAYLNLDFGAECYARNWDYYEKKCETSSSLSYPVHAICAADLAQAESAYRYFMNAARIDLDDQHNCAWGGVHSACAAGAWYAVVRGIAGIVCHEDRVEVHPHMLPFWKQIRLAITWRGQALGIKVTNRAITLTAGKENRQDIPLRFKRRRHALKPGAVKRFAIGLRVDCRKACS